MGTVPDALLMPLETRFSNVAVPKYIDGIIVLAGGFEVSKSGTVQFGTLSRIIQGIILAQQHPEAKLIFSGGSGSVLNQNLREADYMKKLAVKIGISADRILVDSNSRNTRENAVQTADLIKDHRQKNPDAKWVLITSAFHMPRAIGCFRKVGIDPIPYNVEYTQNEDQIFIPLPSPESLIHLKTALKEWIGLMVYRLSGYTSEFFPSPRDLK